MVDQDCSSRQNRDFQTHFCNRFGSAEYCSLSVQSKGIREFESESY